MSTPQPPASPPERSEWASPSGDAFNPVPTNAPATHPTTSAVITERAPSVGTPERVPWSAGRRWALGLGIGAATLGLITGIIAGTVTLTTVLADAFDDLGVVADDAQPLVDGPRAQPVPAIADVCDDPCFSAPAINEARLDPDIYGEAGLSVLYGGAGSAPQSLPSAAFDVAANGWRIDKGTPDSCFVTYPDVPLAYPLDAPPGLSTGGVTDTIHFIASRGSADELSASVHTLRLFSTSAEALTHMETLQSLIDGCRRYQLGESWNAAVTPAPLLELPDSVAAIGWVEVDSFGWRYYSFDLLRANAVVRVTLSTDNGVTEQQFRTLIEQAAVDLATWPLEP